MGATVEVALARVAEWREKWPRIADDSPRDAAGQRPQYSFFYPQEEYRRDILDGITEMVRLEVGDVEVHLHHDNEQRESFIQKVTEFCNRSGRRSRPVTPAGRPRRFRIHSWQLGARQFAAGWQVVRSQRRVALLRDLGCYADFTMPSLPSATQGRVVNQIYWCSNNPDNRPGKSFDRGIEATARGAWRRRPILMITGPSRLALWSGVLLPRLETGEIAGYDMPTRSRVHQWFDFGSYDWRRCLHQALHARRTRQESGIAAQWWSRQSLPLARRGSGSKKHWRYIGPPPGKCTRLPTR